MFEDSFLDLLRQYPDAVADKKLFAALAKDFFPGQQMQVNLILTTYALGIAEDIVKASTINNTFAFRFVKRLVEEYGVSRINADWAVSVWCVCYGKQLLNKPCDIQISKAKSGGAPAIKSESQGNGKQYNDLFLYASVSGGYGIRGFSGDSMRTLIFPNVYQGKPVTRIMANAFESCDVQEVVMTEGITVIEEGAFRNCKQLKQVIYPQTLREICDEAFFGCAELVTAALPGKLEQVGRYAFAGTALRQVVLPQNLLWLGEGAYQGCEKLSSLQLPKTLVEIPDRLMKGCTTIKKITLPDGIHTIGREAFSGCTQFMDMVVPEDVTTIGDDAFVGMNEKFTLLCYPKSAAEKYARNHNLPFQIVF